MKSTTIIPVVLAVVVAGAFYYFYLNPSGKADTAPVGDEQGLVGGAGETPEAASTATNYDECIAEGNKPMPDAPDKCLTKDGHLFIQGVTE